MGSMGRKRNHPHHLPWGKWSLLVFIVFVIQLAEISGSAVMNNRHQMKRQDSPKPQLQLDNFEQLFGDGGDGSSSSEFTILSPLDVSHRGTTGKGKRVVRRRRKKVSTSSTTPSSAAVITSVTVMPSGETITSLPMYEAAPTRRYKKKGHPHKVPEVWKVQNFNLHDGVLRDSDLKTSALDKRESSEKKQLPRNYTSLFLNSNDTTRDLNYDESINNHPFLNSSSTPISNELQNSLQFTLQFLHPLLNSDTVLSEDSPKHPENKTVELTHSLSDSVAQTPIAHDLGFLPAHLKKKHPLLLNQDSILSGEGGVGASKTGIRTKYDMHPINVTTTTTATTTTTIKPSLDTTIFSTTSTKSPESSEVAPKTTTYSTKAPRTRTTTRRIPTPLITRSSTTPSTTTTTATTTTQPITTTVTPLTTTKLPTTITVSTTSTTKPTTTKKSLSTTTTRITTSTGIPFDIAHILGILNITEITTGSSSEATPSSGSTEKDRDQLNEALQHPPVIMFPVEEKAPTTTVKPGDKSKSNLSSAAEAQSPIRNGGAETSSAEVSSAEQLFVEQLLGIGQNNPGIGGTNSQSDSGEQILQLFGSLLQLQNKNQGNANQQNSLLGVLGGSQPQNINGNNPNDAQTNALLQSLILSSLNPQKPNQPDFATNLLNLESLLKQSPTVKPQQGPHPTTTATTKLQLPPTLKAETGLSDADLKSIFELLDSHTSTTRQPTTTTTTTTPRPTTAPPRPTPTPTLTTTLHPALQSMLDLFTNQLKPFQSIPSSAPTFLQTSSKPMTATIPPPTTTKAPSLFGTTTLNSIDLLSQLLSLGGGSGGLNKVNPPRSTPSPSDFSLASIFGGAGIGTNTLPKAPANPEFSLASIFGNIGKNSNNNNIFPSKPSLPKVPVAEQPSAPSESNQLLNYFGTHQPTPPPPNGLYYWLDMNAFLGGDPQADGMAGIRPKIGNRFPFIKVH